MAVYYASKAYVLSLSEALWMELQGSGVTCTALCPGPVATPFIARAGVGHLRLLRSAPKLSTEQVARIGIDAMNAGRRVAVAGVVNKIAAALARLTPHFLLLRIVKYMQSARGK
jgi:short-subunit dehydrogenase